MTEKVDFGTGKYDIVDILRELFAHEREAVNVNQELFVLVKYLSALLDEYARRLITKEETHKGEVDKILR